MLALAKDGTQLTLKSPFQSRMLPLIEAGIQLCHLNRAVRGQIPAEQKLLSKFANFLAKKNLTCQSRLSLCSGHPLHEQCKGGAVVALQIHGCL